MEALIASIANLINDNILLGPIVYILIAVSAIVITPISTLPFIPFAAKKFGWVATAVYTEIGWVLGGFIAFLLARYFGKKVVSRFLSIEKIEALEKKIPKKLGFFSIILLRMLTPADIVSYLLGFTKISMPVFLLTAVIGIAPGVVALSYFGEAIFTFKHPALVILAFVAFFAIYFAILKIREKKFKKIKLTTL